MKIYSSICGMCTVRCPIRVQVENGEVTWLQGNPDAGMGESLCPRGAAGVALLKDNERPQSPMIRDGARGEGKWRQVGWDEALDHVADRLKDVTARHGAQSILFSDRGGPFVDLHQAFVRGLGSPNYCNHDTSCARNTHHAAVSVFGSGRKTFSYDLKNAAHVVLQTRNIFEAINVKEVRDLSAAMDHACQLTVIDVRWTATANRANNFFMIRPGSDYGFNLAVLNVLIREGLYDKPFVQQWVKDFNKLETFIQPYSPEWAERETGIPARQLVEFTRRLAEVAPRVIWHPGWNTARYFDSFYVARTAYLINALLGSIGAKGGLPLVSKPSDVGKKDLKPLVDLFPKPTEKRVDGAGWKYPHLDSGPGLICRALSAIESKDPYPVKAYFCYRHDPLMAIPDPGRIKKLLDQLEFLVSVTFTWSDTAWYSDIVLPLSVYLERDSIVSAKNGLKPYFFVRQQAVAPRYETRNEWEIFAGVLKRLGRSELDFDSIEELRDYQLQGTGYTAKDLEATGIIQLADQPRYLNRGELKFKTPSGLIEVVSEKWESQGLPSLKPYESPQTPPEGTFRLIFGRTAQHTQGHTVNNPLLNEIMPTNQLWINQRKAAELGIADGDWVEVSGNGNTGRIKARVIEFIHPECVFMVHGFGHDLPVESRARGKGVADHKLMSESLEKWSAAGGALCMQENFVQVKRA